MKKRNLFLIFWIGGFGLMLMFSAIAQSFEADSAMYNVFMFIAVGFMVAAIVFIVMWKKTCPSCKEGKLVYTSMEDGEAFMTTQEVADGKSVTKDKQGNVLRTTQHTKTETYEVTPLYKIYTCNNCGYHKKKLKSTRRTS